MRRDGCAGNLTVPAVAYDGSAAGLSADGRTLVLIAPRAAFPRLVTPIRILGAVAGLRPRAAIRLRGDFSIDAVSLGLACSCTSSSTRRVTNPTLYAVRALDAPDGAA